MLLKNHTLVSNLRSGINHISNGQNKDTTLLGLLLV